MRREDEAMNKRSTKLILPLSQHEKEFLLQAAKESHLLISDFILLAALSVNPGVVDISKKLSVLDKGTMQSEKF